jgi:ABC-type polysaccharide/polyol phosphate transport system ATPase subunit
MYPGAIDSLLGIPSMSNFREFDRETPYLLPPSLNDWLLERHLARFVVEVIEGLDLSAMENAYCLLALKLTMARIELRNVHVDFPLLQSEQRSFKRLLSTPFQASRLGTDQRQRIVLHALRSVNMTLQDGDRIALIGANGAGKSTLLRVLAGIYPPVAGTVAIEGRVGALLTTGLGMRDDASGYENIEFCLLLLGVPPQEIPQRREEVSAFSELGKYLDLHVGAYSSGMRVRLAFAISTALDPDILVIDEIFGAGDAGFMKKAEKRMVDIITRSSILVFASHTPELIARFCDRAMWLDAGKIRQDGPIKEVYQAYLASIG